MKWKVHSHAAEAVQKRFGIRKEHVNNFVNQMMEHSARVYCNEKGREAYAHTTKDFFAVVNPVEGIVITVIDKKAEQVAVRSPFLDEILPKMERELHKMERDYRRKVRAMEKQIAELTIERGETLKKRANVYHPDTQDTLMARAVTLDNDIIGVQAQIDAMKESYEAAALKLQRFIWTSAE